MRAFVIAQPLYMPLTARQRKFLKALAHKKKPVVLVGQAGLTATVLKETQGALAHHELIKVRLPSIGRDERTALLQQMAEDCGAETVQEIGRIGVLYKKSTKSRIKLPD
jgi:RNA-binding protein